jgi:antitoxin HicB
MFNSQYPMTFSKDKDGSYIVEISHPNKRFQGVTDGEDFDRAMINAHELLGELIISTIEDNESIPLPEECDKGTHNITVPPLTAAKAMLYLEMKKQGVKKSALARKLRCDPKQITRIIAPRHKSTFAQMEAAFNALGKHIIIRIESTA